MEPTLHLKQGLTLLEKVLKFYPLLREGDEAEVALTQQDWLVLFDFVHHPESKGMLPENVASLSGDLDNRAILIDTDGCRVSVTIGM